MPYNPNHDRVTDPVTLCGFIDRFPLASLVTVDADGVPDGNLLPLLVVRDQHAACGLALRGHVARANPVWEPGNHEGSSMAVFGPAEHYISPGWYPSKAETHRVVPTWNYLVVHAWGRLEVHDDRKWVRGEVARLTRRMEQGREQAWHMGQAPRDYIEQMLTGIVGVEVRVDRLEGRFKVSAHRREADRLGARDGVLGERRGRAWQDLADRMGAVQDR